MSENDDASTTPNPFSDHGASMVEIQHSVEERIRSCSYAFQFHRVQWRYSSGTLTLSGCVATFYLKQVLQTMLRDLNQVQHIINDVDVVSATGLSSERSGQVDEHESNSRMEETRCLYRR